MQRKKTASAVLLAALLGFSAAAFAQGPAGNSNGAATIPGSEVRAGETRPPHMSTETTTGSTATREMREMQAEPTVNSKVNVNTPPAGAGSPVDGSAAAPAGR